jgi:predicted O-methyltransferase YrrM
MYQTLQYLKFLFTSTNHHGVHSPFVYDLITRCLYDKNAYEPYKQLKSYRKALRSNQQQISITDLGAGSKLSQTKELSVNELAKTSGSSLRRAKCLYRMVKYHKPKHILELGTSLGIATQAMALGTKDAMITSIEGCPSLSAFAKQQLDTFQIKNVHLKVGDFKDQIPVVNQQTWDLIFFDGNHQKEATLHYFEQLLPTAHNETVFIFDDIYWSKAMTEAWNTMIQHPKVGVTVDTFHWGLVFFKKELTKENFKIRV